LKSHLCYLVCMGYYNPPRFRNIYLPGAKEPYNLSRSKIDSFVKCPRCFYLDRRLGVDQPPMPSFSLNDAVDVLLKKEFDILRKSGQRHELMEKYGINAVPLVHPELSDWRDDQRKFLGANTLHKETNFRVSGIVDDVWVTPEGTFIIVDYKATSTAKEISLEDEYKQGYKRQVELYQWIFRQKGFKVSDIAYFVFANAKKDNEKFDGQLEFAVNIIAHDGNDAWVEPTLQKIYKCLNTEEIPPFSENCDYCKYRKFSRKLEIENEQNSATAAELSKPALIKEEKLTKQPLF